MSCDAIAKVLLLDDDTIPALGIACMKEDGIEGLTNFGYEGQRLPVERRATGKAERLGRRGGVAAHDAPSRRAWIENEFGVVYEGRSGLIALLHRLGLEYHKPNVIPRKLDEEKQKAFIEGYEKLLNSLGDDEAVLFADAVHPTHAARPAGCWAPSYKRSLRSSRRVGVNASTFTARSTWRPEQTRMIEALTIDAASTIRLLQTIESLNPM